MRRVDQLHQSLFGDGAHLKPPTAARKGREEVVRKKGSTRHSRSQYGDDRSVSSQGGGRRGMSHNERKIIQAYMPPLNKGILKKHFGKPSRASGGGLQPTKSESRIKQFQQGVHSSYFNHPRVGSVEQSPSSVKSFKSNDTRLARKKERFQQLNIYSNIRVGRKASQHRVLPGNSVGGTQMVRASPRSKSQPARKPAPRYVFDQDDYCLAPLDKPASEVLKYLEDYTQKLDRGFRETFFKPAPMLAEIRTYGFETVFLKQTYRGTVTRLVVFTNDSSSYLRRRVRLLHISVTGEQQGQEERGPAFKRLLEMALNYIWKFTLADEIKLELVHFRPEPGEDLQPD